MKDDKRIVEIDGVKYSIDRTFDDSPAIFQHIKDGELHHIDDTKSKTHISSLTLGSGDDMVIILARKVK